MRILVIGDVCVDEYRYGEIRRVNPESAAPLLNFQEKEEKLGMAYNVAQNLQALGVDVVLAGSPQLSRKIRYIDRRTGEHLLRVDLDAESLPYEHKYDYAEFDAIVISDYDKGYVWENTIREIREMYKGPIYMDTKKKNLASFPGIYIKINQRELYDSTSLPERDKLIVTYGSKGCGYLDSLYPAKVIDVVDVCGAGDVFLASMVVKHLLTGDMDIALPFANERAAISCQSIGAVCVS
jgi:D-beta-D-heptose 7-phosphate kinase/D-beta-D-heptose 1-phosphate adenosyltransferase